MKDIVRIITQSYADVISVRIKNEVNSTDDALFLFLFEQAAKLNAYCVIFYDIYLD